MSEIKLLPCPFCGAKATKVINPKGDERWVMFKCPTFGCIQQQGFCRDEKEAIRLWNTRKPMREIVEKLEEEYKFYDEQKKEAYEDKDWEDFDRNMHINRGIYEALVIVKEVGGMNESNDSL